jgi:hypothetical protein
VAPAHHICDPSVHAADPYVRSSADHRQLQRAFDPLTQSSDPPLVERVRIKAIMLM